MAKERNDVLTSAACYAAMVALVVGLGFKFGPLMIFNLYVIPYWVRLEPTDATQTVGGDDSLVNIRCTPSKVAKCTFLVRVEEVVTGSLSRLRFWIPDFRSQIPHCSSQIVELTPRPNQSTLSVQQLLHHTRRVLQLVQCLV